MVFDFKKEYKEFYLPDKKPGIIMVPNMNYLAVRGQGDPNREDQGLICYLRDLLVLSIIHVGTPSSFMLFANFGRSAISILLWGTPSHSH